MSKFCINRPIFAMVLSIVITLVGVICITILPVEEYPQVVPNEIVVSATYSGASAEVMANTVASIIEDSINGVEGMLYMKSSSTSSGVMNLNVFFSNDANADMALVNVTNRVQSALAQLPAEVQRVGITTRKRSSTLLAVYAMYSDNPAHSSTFVANYGILNVINELKRVPGVGDVTPFGSQDYSMRIWLDIDKLSQNNLTPSEVAKVVSEQNSQFAVGSFGKEPMRSDIAFTYSVTTQGRFVSAEEFGNIIIRSNADGSALRLKDVAKVELGAKDYSVSPLLDGKHASAFGIALQPGANALDVASAVEKKMQELSLSFPNGLHYKNVYNTTSFVKISINEVIKTFIEAIVLVIIIMYFFLQNFRATIIPVIAIPVSIIGTFAGMYVLGFSINLLTLFGLILAIGIVVDDAIIVIENVERILHTETNELGEKYSVKEATLKAMGEIQGPVVAIVLVLCSVFIPVAFIGGFSGAIYKQFAITIVISVVISGFVALSLTPALCVSILKAKEPKPFYLVRRFNDFFDWLTHKFGEQIGKALRRGILLVALFVAILITTWGLFSKLPTGLVPSEDKGSMMSFIQLSPAASLSRTITEGKKGLAILGQEESVDSGFLIAGFDMLASAARSSGAVIFVTLKDWSERKESAFAIAQKMMGAFNANLDAFSLVTTPPAIMGLSTVGGFELYIQDRSGGSIKDLEKYANLLVTEANKREELLGVRSLFSANIPQYHLNLDRERAKAMNVNVDDVFTTMQSTFGQHYVNDFNLYGKTYQVNIQAQSEFRESPEDLSRIFVKSSNGDLIPISTLVSFERVIGADIVDRFNLFTSAKVIGNANETKGYSSGDALRVIEGVAKEILPDGYTIAYSGTSYQEKNASGTGKLAFIFGLIFVFLILCAQYERWLMPLSVLTAVPFAVFGACLATMLRGLSNDIYFQIGLVMLIALSAKNAILIVEFAQHLHEKEGKGILESAIGAAKLRFRPIIMTSLAFSIGVLPLALSSGAGSASRHAIGTGVIGGMLAATFIAIFFIPLFWSYVARFNEWLRQRRSS
ncbi:putative multidrug resistance protein MexB [Helicobacter cinaedi PAGU611]|uniref:efflux RND transporter permease subunit n=2 Tax=Helicobacter cinaedi TaxID=213 RepID=UPI00025D3330|nr:multidrug efflux RND transporter permease subunit [Helicobacter cinaedi]AWK62193.1 multidrug efflux RND transporter permease subunit [Helicobacter cinaedi]QOQ95260.1 multidrug efflux RND transporter permease subunit [Helicobacter cinaedi]BAM12759.1 putative multidrug resistance protein MexB [Helicobacter cinaedi PAGU611]